MRGRGRIAEALGLATELRDRQSQAKELVTLGQIEEREGRFENARRHYLTAQALGDWALENPRRHVILLNSLGEVERKAGCFETALRYHDEELAYARGRDDERGIAFALYSLGEVARDNGDLVVAVKLADAAWGSARGGLCGAADREY